MADADGLRPNHDPTVGFDPLDPKEVIAHYTLVRNSTNTALNPRQDNTPPKTFEIALVLGGTVSAGCYTAGVLDFLIEALDAWTMAKAAGDAMAPKHNVRIKIVAGTSGGGINAILLARALGYEAAPYDPEAGRITNLLRSVWVDKIDISSLLQTTDIAEGKPVKSVLCADVLDAVGDAAGTYTGRLLGSGNTPARRDYVDEFLPLVLTVTNLRGVQYAADFRSSPGRKEFYADHADHLGFLVNVSGKPHPVPPATLRPEECWIDYTTNTAPYGCFRYPWGPLVEAARATSAFPVGLPPIVIHRDVEQYRYRFTAAFATDGAPEVNWIRPEWTYLIADGMTRNDPYTALCVDGGVFNNEPICFAHDRLAGPLGCNPREGDKANRAVLLVDPFSDAGDIGPDRDIGLMKTALSLFGALKGGARFQTSDLGLFADDNVYSRFLVTPVRKVEKDGVSEVFTGGEAIVSSSFSAFMGFLCRKYREHDFLLGRRNCQQFLRAHFTLKQENPLFDDWTPEQIKKFRQRDADGIWELPVIPLMGSANPALDQPEWPAGQFDPESLRQALDNRLHKVSDAEVECAVHNPVSRLALKLVLRGLGDRGGDGIVEMLKGIVRDRGL